MKKPYTIEVNVNPEPDFDKGQSYLIMNTDCQSDWNLHNQKQLLRDLRKIQHWQAIRYLDIKVPDNPYDMKIYFNHLFPKLENKAVRGVEISNSNLITTSAERRNMIRFIIDTMISLYTNMQYVNDVYFHIMSIESVPMREEDWQYILWSVLDSMGSRETQKKISWKKWNHVYHIDKKEIDAHKSKGFNNLWEIVNNCKKDETYHGEYIIEEYTGQNSIMKYELFEIETDDYINWRSGIQDVDENLEDVTEAVFIDKYSEPDDPSND